MNTWFYTTTSIMLLTVGCSSTPQNQPSDEPFAKNSSAKTVVSSVTSLSPPLIIGATRQEKGDLHVIKVPGLDLRSKQDTPQKIPSDVVSVADMVRSSKANQTNTNDNAINTLPPTAAGTVDSVIHSAWDKYCNQNLPIDELTLEEQQIVIHNDPPNYDDYHCSRS